MIETTVVNMKVTEHDVYIGRKRHGHHFGNPFSCKDESLASIMCEDRGQSIGRFRAWLTGDQRWSWVEPDRRAWIIEHLNDLRGKRLGCFCYPHDCHGDIYLEIFDDNWPTTIKE